MTIDGVDAVPRLQSGASAQATLEHLHRAGTVLAWTQPRRNPGELGLRRRCAGVSLQCEHGPATSTAHVAEPDRPALRRYDPAVDDVAAHHVGEVTIEVVEGI